MHPLLSNDTQRQHGVVCSRDLRRAGIGHQEVRTLCASGRWTRLRRGAFVDTEVLRAAEESGRRYLLEASAVVLSLDRPEAVLSAGSAARVWGLPVHRGLTSTITLTDPEQSRRGRGFEVARAPLPPGSTTEQRQLPVTTLARTIADCARAWSLEHALVVADAARWGNRLPTDELHRAVDAVAGWRGAAAARRVAELTRDGAQSPLETRTRLRLLGGGIAVPQLQVELAVDGVTAVVDGWWPEAGVAMECDGRVKYREPWGGRTTEQAHWEEKRRAEQLSVAGVRFWRVAESDVWAGWAADEARLRAMLAHPLPGPRRFTDRLSPRRAAVTVCGETVPSR